MPNPIVPAIPNGYVPQMTPPGGIDPIADDSAGALANPGGTVTLPITVSEVNGLQGR